MLQVLTKKLTTVLLSILLGLVVFGFAPNAAIASKTPEAFPLDTSNESVMVATIYQTSYPTQKNVLKVLKLGKATLKKAMGFKGMSIFQSQDGFRVVALSQWQDLASYQTYAAKPIPLSEAEEPLESVPMPDRTMFFEIAETQVRQSGAIPTIRGKEAMVEFSQFSLKNSVDQPKVLAQLEGWMTTVLQQQPMPQSVTLLKSTDDTAFALLANWNCTADFEETGKPTGFEQPDETMTAMVEADQRFYKVARIMPGTPKKVKSKS